MSELRPVLGDFSSIVCFKAVVVGVEDTLGEQAARVVLCAAGRKRGKDLVNALGLGGKDLAPSETTAMLEAALGADGTRLCTIEGIEEIGSEIRVRVSDTVCMAGEPIGTARTCSFTLGAVHGALEALTGRKLRGKHTESRWRGEADDIFEFKDRL